MKIDPKVKKELLGLLNGMDIPVHRRKLDSNHDISWLHRNLATRNLNNKNYDQTINLINQLL
jgi:hypothetical protein